MSARSATSAWKTRSGRGITNGGRPVAIDREIPEGQDRDQRVHPQYRTTIRPSTRVIAVTARGSPRRAGRGARSAGRAPSSRRIPASAPEVRAPGPRGRHPDDLEDAPGRGGEDQHAIRQQHRLVDVVGDEEDRLRAAGELGWPSHSPISSRFISSRAENGSSISSTGGSWASALAMLTRWSIPPESWCGRLSSCPPSPNSRSRSPAGKPARPRDALGERGRRRWRASRAARPAAATRDPSRRCCAGLRRPAAGRSGPRRWSAHSRSATIRSRVVLPQPDGPDQRDELARRDLQIHAVQRERLAEAPRDVPDRDRQHAIELHRPAAARLVAWVDVVAARGPVSA